MATPTEAGLASCCLVTGMGEGGALPRAARLPLGPWRPGYLQGLLQARGTSVAGLERHTGRALR